MSMSLNHFPIQVRTPGIFNVKNCVFVVLPYRIIKYSPLFIRLDIVAVAFVSHRWSRAHVLDMLMLPTWSS